MVAAVRPIAVALIALASASTSGCVEGPPDQTLGDAPLARLACVGEAPACLSACGQRTITDVAACDAGVWRCGSGIREDLCCDPARTPERCPDWGERCAMTGLADDACTDGYTCVRSQAFPIPTASGQSGICRLGDWSLSPYDRCDGREALVWPDVLIDPTHRDAVMPLQLEGVVGVVPDCEDHECPKDDACCQRCQGSYTLDLVTSSDVAVRIGVRTETLACTGNNCGFSCAPLQPGRRYRVWGLWDPTVSGGSGTLYYAGHCAD
ncbi:MAG: hypothetical protein IT385_20905 [Deltaproteobacteria bacterium]|nr:hypothetical protein [Deltaproteobacteria bacterium]